MDVFESVTELKENLQKIKKQGHDVGFVPTMGALHEGHISLIKESIKENDFTVCSIFVNPTQFDNPDDFNHYPSTIESDLKLLKEAGCSAVFVPSVAEMYPNGPISKSYQFGGIENEMEGKHRKGHFDGVGTVVSQLFDHVHPDKAYFGEKDFQQLLIIKKLVEILNLDIEIVGCSIKREESGLAMSSRNKRLSQVEFDSSKFIYEQLLLAKESLNNSSIAEIKKQIEANFEKHPLFELEYFSISNAKTLKEVDSYVEGESLRAFIAAYIGEVRLIDNIALI